VPRKPPHPTRLFVSVCLVRCHLSSSISLNTAQSPSNSRTHCHQFLCFLSDSFLNTTSLLFPPSLFHLPPTILSPITSPLTLRHRPPRVSSQEWTTTRITQGLFPMINLCFSLCHLRYCIVCSALSSFGAHVTQLDSLQLGGGQDTQQVVVFIAVGVIRTSLNIPIVSPVPRARRNVES
jgi:hypothetical protein